MDKMYKKILAKCKIKIKLDTFFGNKILILQPADSTFAGCSIDTTSKSQNLQALID